MIAFAKFVLASPMRATLVTLVLGLFSLSAWLGTAIGVLALWRFSWRASAVVQMGLLVGVLTQYLYNRDFISVAVVLMAWLSASTVHISGRLKDGLLTLALLGSGCWLVSGWFVGPEQLSALDSVQQVLLPPDAPRLDPAAAEPLLRMASAATATALTLLALLLARSWLAQVQHSSMMFREEFCTLRLSLQTALPLVLAALAAYLLALPALSIFLLLPLLLAGLGLVHWNTKREEMRWLPWVVYPLLVLFQPQLFLLLVGVALSDTLFDWRNSTRVF